jgi:2-octaprenyl-6-methoxyphenol hydroxylase
MRISEVQNITVIGAGPAGLVAALALARIGADVVMAAPFHHTAIDQRTTAVLGGGIDLLDNLGVWDTCAPASAPLRAIRIIDDTDGLIRGPEVLFRAEDVGLSQFGANIPNAVLISALLDKARQTSRVKLHGTAAVTTLDASETAVAITDAEGRTWRSSLVVGADGRASTARAAAGIETRTWNYPQTAVVTTLFHTRSHEGISTEFHRKPGPLTTVPLSSPAEGGYASSLVWVETPTEAERLQRLDANQFSIELAARLQGLLGRITIGHSRSAFPLNGLNAARMSQNRIALVGEAAHVLPPIGAQGLNLGLRDAATLADCVADGLAAGSTPGDPSILAAYNAARATDVKSRTFAVDVLNRSLLMDLFPAQFARSIGLHLTANVAGIKQFAMRQGLEPLGQRPRLMQPSTGVASS